MEQEALEMRRMLLWFKAQLPPHDLTDWDIYAHPVTPPIEIEGRAPIGMARGFRIQGHGKCQRCGRHFLIPRMGNAVALDEAHIPTKVQEMKEWTERDAQREGPCWGDVPEPRDDSLVPVLDLV